MLALLGLERFAEIGLLEVTSHWFTTGVVEASACSFELAWWKMPGFSLVLLARIDESMCGLELVVSFLRSLDAAVELFVLLVLVAVTVTLARVLLALLTKAVSLSWVLLTLSLTLGLSLTLP